MRRWCVAATTTTTTTTPLRLLGEEDLQLLRGWVIEFTRGAARALAFDKLTANVVGNVAQVRRVAGGWGVVFVHAEVFREEASIDKVALVFPRGVNHLARVAGALGLLEVVAEDRAREAQTLVV